MDTHSLGDLVDFHRFVGEKLENGGGATEE